VGPKPTRPDPTRPDPNIQRSDRGRGSITTKAFTQFEQLATPVRRGPQRLDVHQASLVQKGPSQEQAQPVAGEGQASHIAAVKRRHSGVELKAALRCNGEDIFTGRVYGDTLNRTQGLTCGVPASGSLAGSPLRGATSVLIRGKDDPEAVFSSNVSIGFSAISGDDTARRHVLRIAGE